MMKHCHVQHLVWGTVFGLLGAVIMPWGKLGFVVGVALGVVSATLFLLGPLVLALWDEFLLPRLKRLFCHSDSSSHDNQRKDLLTPSDSDPK